MLHLNSRHHFCTCVFFFPQNLTDEELPPPPPELTADKQAVTMSPAQMTMQQPAPMIDSNSVRLMTTPRVNNTYQPDDDDAHLPPPVSLFSRCHDWPWMAVGRVSKSGVGRLRISPGLIQTRDFKKMGRAKTGWPVPV